MSTANWKGIFHGAIVTGGITLVVLLFSNQGRDEVKVEQKIQRVEKRISEKQFDAEFDRRWNGSRPAPQNLDTSADEKELADLKIKQKQLEGNSNDAQDGFIDELSQAGGGTASANPKIKNDLENALKKGSKPQ